jgi:hypothetical protein
MAATGMGRREESSHGSNGAGWGTRAASTGDASENPCIKVGKKFRKKGTPGKSKSKRKGKRSPSPTRRTAGSSDTTMEGAEVATNGKEEAEVL